MFLRSAAACVLMSLARAVGARAGFALCAASAAGKALGAKIEVPTLDGRSLLRVPPGTSSGQKLRLREKGVPSVRQPGKRGDLYVELQVVVPKPIDERVRNLLRELARLEPENPRRDLFARAGA